MTAFAHDVAIGWRALGVVILHGTVLAALAWLLAATVLRGARPALLAALWTVVLVKFALPVGPALPFSLSDAIAHVFNNYLSPGLRSKSGFFRAYLGSANVLNQAQLGFSGYHAFFTALDSVFSKSALALQFRQGHLTGWKKDWRLLRPWPF